MGFLDDYDVDPNDFEESGFDVPDGTYSFETLGGELKEGTKDDEDAVHIIINFNLENEDGEVRGWNWWLRVPSDPGRPTRRESISMSDWKKWCLGAGFSPEEVRSVGPEDVEGITGTVRLVTGKPTKGRDAGFQNPKDWTFDGVESEHEEPEEKPAARKAPAKTAAKPAARKAAPKEEPEEEEAAPRATRTRAKANPFQKK